MNLLARLRGGYCISLILGLLVLIWSPPGEAGASSEGTRVLEGVKGFPLDYDSGNMAIHALSSSIEAMGGRSGYNGLAGLSGAAFKFVYDSTEAYEPLRDLYPVDVLRQAAKAVGFPGAHWEVNKSIDTVKTLIKGEIDSGRPLIAPFLKKDAYHGFFIITGYDYGENILDLQGALGLDSGYVEVHIPDLWDGPTASPEGWAGNPVFVFGEAGRQPTRSGTEERLSVEAAIRLFRGGTLEYGTHPGEYEYMEGTGPRSALYGLPAYDILSAEVEKRPLLKGSGSDQALDFGLLWRLDTQLGQLEHDRNHGAAYLRSLSTYLRPEQNDVLIELIENFEKVVADTRQLRRVFWDPVPEWCASPEDIVRYIEQQENILYRVPDDEAMLSGLEALGFEIHGGLWGPTVIVDSREKRIRAKMLVISIASREKNSLYLMEEIVEHIGRQSPQPNSRRRVTREVIEPDGN